MQDDDDSKFGDLIPGVKRMRSDRVNLYAQRQRKKFNRPSEGRFDTESANYPSEGGIAHGSFFNSGLQKKLQRKIRQGQIRPEASLDLHGYRQHEALAELERFLAAATSERLRLVIIVHGQGFRSQQDAVLKPLVQRWLAAQPEVLGWCPAQPRDGAAGATYVYLRNS